MAREIGDKVGPKLADLIGKYTLAARRDHAPLEAKIRTVAAQGIIDRAGLETGQHLREIIGRSIELSPDMPEHVRGYLQRTASGRHQWQAITGAISMSGAGSALSEILSNFLAPAVYEAVSASPHLK